MDIAQRIPSPAEPEQDRVRAGAALKIAEEKKEQQTDKSAPLKVEMSYLRHPPRQIRIDDSGEQRGDPVPCNPARQRPGGNRGQENPHQEEGVIDGKRRQTQGVERKSER